MRKLLNSCSIRVAFAALIAVVGVRLAIIVSHANVSAVPEGWFMVIDGGSEVAKAVRARWLSCAGVPALHQNCDQESVQGAAGVVITPGNEVSPNGTHRAGHQG